MTPDTTGGPVPHRNGDAGDPMDFIDPHFPTADTNPSGARHAAAAESDHSPEAVTAPDTHAGPVDTPAVPASYRDENSKVPAAPTPRTEDQSVPLIYPTNENPLVGIPVKPHKRSRKLKWLLLALLVVIVIAVAAVLGTRVVKADPPTHFPKLDVTWVGDEVLRSALTADPILGDKGMTLRIHAPADQTPAQGLDHLAKTPPGRVVVWAFGTIDTVTDGDLAKLTSILGPDRGLVLVGPGSSPRSPEFDAVSARYDALTKSRPHTKVMQWQKVIDNVPSVVSNKVAFSSPQAARTWTSCVNWELTAVTADLMMR